MCLLKVICVLVVVQCTNVNMSPRFFESYFTNFNYLFGLCGILLTVALRFLEITADVVFH